MAVTDNYGLYLPTQGGDTSVWGTLLNTGSLAPIDAVLGAKLPVAITSADVNLSTTQFQNAIFVASGALTGNRSLIVPLSPNSLTVACGGRFVVVNNCTGSFALTVKTAASGSTGVIVPPGFAAFLYSDGTNVGYAINGLPGYAAAWAGDPNTHVAGTAGSTTTNASLAYDYTNNVFYVCTTSGVAAAAVWSKPIPSVLRGFDDVINLRLNASVAGNLLTIAVKSAETAGDPSATSPVTAQFRDSTVTAGDPVTVAITAALSISTLVGASLGSSNSVPFRFWVVLFNNGGTPVLGLINCSTSTRIYPLNEAAVASSTAMSAAATAAGTIYTPSGSTLTNKAFRIIGFVSYETALATAGTYNNAPDVVQLFGPGIKKPGDVVQTMYLTTTTQTSTPAASTVNTATALAGSITPASKVNLIRVQAMGNAYGIIINNNAFLMPQLYRNTGGTAIGNVSASGAGGGTNQFYPISCMAIDKPASASAVQYGLYIKMSTVVNDVWTFLDSSFIGTNSGVMTLDELMG